MLPLTHRIGRLRAKRGALVVIAEGTDTHAEAAASLTDIAGIVVLPERESGHFPRAAWPDRPGISACGGYYAAA